MDAASFSLFRTKLRIQKITPKAINNKYTANNNETMKFLHLQFNAIDMVKLNPGNQRCVAQG